VARQQGHDDYHYELELHATQDLVFPVGLARLLRRLLAGDRPQDPVHFPWTYRDARAPGPQ
jgi:hypothetical protein